MASGVDNAFARLIRIAIAVATAHKIALWRRFMRLAVLFNAILLAQGVMREVLVVVAKNADSSRCSHTAMGCSKSAFALEEVNAECYYRVFELRAALARVYSRFAASTLIILKHI